LAATIFDTSEIVHRTDAGLTPGIAAFELLLDIIGLHRWLLDLLSELDWMPDCQTGWPH
jgi:hypothetical protein